ncbi:MAG TPA: nucleotidyltransferase domain-containing protein [Desulfuromonadales bacterium]|nr:nucleotidyltransferase domain-containing protein [Desulfuromonadales bacterium]
MSTEELKNHIATYCATRPEIVACYLFGSRATGKERPGSDADIAFLLDNTVVARDYFDLKMAYLSALGALLRLDIHPLIMNDAGEVVLGQIFKKGVPVYGFDSLECIRFRMLQFSLIAEFAPLRDKMEEILFRKYKEAC